MVVVGCGVLVDMQVWARVLVAVRVLVVEMVVVWMWCCIPWCCSGGCCMDGVGLCCRSCKKKTRQIYESQSAAHKKWFPAGICEPRSGSQKVVGC